MYFYCLKCFLQVVISNLSVSAAKITILYTPVAVINHSCNLNDFYYVILNLLASGSGVASHYYDSTFAEVVVSLLVSTAYYFEVKFVDLRGRTHSVHMYLMLLGFICIGCACISLPKLLKSLGIDLIHQAVDDEET